MIALLACVLAIQPESKTYQVDGVDRRALIFAPSKKSAHPPLVFGFHGHGGTAKNSASKFDLQSHWPEAVVVYMQGLATRTSRDPQGLRAGWQNLAGADGDRDLKFFDAVLEDVTHRLSIDPKRIFAMGHSNGAGFTYTLWQMRHDKLAAVGAVAGTFRERLGLRPLPCFVAAGTRDNIVDFDQQVRGIRAMAKFSGVTDDVDTSPKLTSRLYKGSKADLMVFIYDGTHAFPEAATPQMVEFFKNHPRP